MTALASLLATLTALLSMVGGSVAGTPVVGVVVSPVAGTASSPGGWSLVPRPRVVRGFDPPQSTWGAGHRGVDLLGRLGQSVHAARAGRVTFAGTLAGRGVLVVDHGDVRTTYEPVTARVRVGDRVRQGQRIGTLQLGGSHCFPRACLRWGLLRGRTYLDPLMLVGGGPVRLLPLTGSPPGSTGQSAARPSAARFSFVVPQVGARSGARLAARIGGE